MSDEGRKRRETLQNVKEKVERALRAHNVNIEDISETARFLAQVIGGMIGAAIPAEGHKSVVKGVIEDVEYGIDVGIPESGVSG